MKVRAGLGDLPRRRRGPSSCASVRTRGWDMTTGMVRIEGGYVGVDARDLLHAWRACLGGEPGVGGFRAWLAAREMVARPHGRGGRRPPAYDVAELAALLDVSPRTAAAAIRRLAVAGLL